MRLVTQMSKRRVYVKSFEIFKPGKHTAVSGAVLEFTEAMLQQAAQAYDPSLHEAPLTVGHPKDNLPAYGWVKSVAYAEGVLTVEPHQVEESFSEMVGAGRFKKRSASFYLPDAPNNPKPGTLYLRHVAFLGAQPPAVKGLKDVAFNDTEEGVIEFADWGHSTSASLFRGLRDWLVEQFGLEKADKVLPSWQIDSLKEAADPPRAVAYSEPPPNPASKEAPTVGKTTEELAAEAAALKEREAKLKADEAAFAERQKADNKARLVAFCDSLVKEGRLLPKDQPGLVAFMEQLPAAGTVEFGEGADKKTATVDEWLRGFLAGMPVQVDFTERAGAGKKEPEPDISGDSQAIARKALEFQESESKAGRQISIDVAVQHVTTQGASK